MRLLDALLGSHCPLECGQRIYPWEAAVHLRLNHAGDRDAPPRLILEVTDPSVAAVWLRTGRTTP